MQKTRSRPTVLALLAASAFGLVSAGANSLLLDFGQTNVATPYLTISPGHSAGAVPSSDTTWNKIASSAPTSSLLFGDGTAASGITLSLGQEAAAGSGSISYTTAILSLNLAGTGGGIAGQQSLLSAGSIYGNDSTSTATGRDGFFDSGSAAAGNAIGIRLDGLAAGDYLLYVMARNVNSNGPLLPMNVFAAAGVSANSFSFSSLTAHSQSNVGYAAAGYAGQYNSFVEGENYVGLSVSVGAGESLFLAVDGGSAGETRGFLNSLAITPVPEPSAVALLAVSGLGLFAVRRRHNEMK